MSKGMMSFVERHIRKTKLKNLLRMAAVLELDLGEVIQRASKAASKEHTK
jgi:hypothetical protein